jgi:hypothetical protein
MVAFVSGFYDCNGPGCLEALPPSGLGELALGLVVTAIFLAPGVLLHRFLRSRGR